MDKVKRYSLEIGFYFDKVNAIYCGEKCTHARTSNGGCCCRCNEFLGYLEFCDTEFHTYCNSGLYSTKEGMKLLKLLQKKYKWTESWGFFSRKEKHCKLPREKRSITCLKYACDGVEAVLGRELIKRIEKLCHRIYEIRKRERILM